MLHAFSAVSERIRCVTGDPRMFHGDFGGSY